MNTNKKTRAINTSATTDCNMLKADFIELEPGNFEVSGTGELRIVNTGGSSASEGGMGSDSDDQKAKGDITLPGGEKAGNAAGDEEDGDISFDPIKKNVREAERKHDKE